MVEFNIGDRDIDVVVDLLNSQVKGVFPKHCALIIHLILVSFFLLLYGLF